MVLATFWSLVLLASLAASSPNSVARRSATDAPAFTYPTFANPAAAAYRVSTSTLPLFKGIAVQDSWAGRVNPASTPGSGLFFWYFPSSQVGGSKKLSIWLNGGPGCSSLEGATQENGAFIFTPGATHPVLNPNGWTTVSDMLYIDQPAGVGYSTGSNANLTGEVALADAFYIFLQAFYGVFPELVSKSLYLTGESYAGFYIPYIATRILGANKFEKKTLPLSLSGMIVNDGVYSDPIVSAEAPIARFAAKNAAILGFDSAFLKRLMRMSVACGYEDLLDAAVYPQPPGNIDLPRTWVTMIQSATQIKRCDVAGLYSMAAAQHNPYFNPYRITDTFKSIPTSDLIAVNPYVNETGTYLSRPDVQAALHVAKSSDWLACTTDNPFVNGIDASAFSETLLPAILAKIPVLLWHGEMDSVLMTGGNYVTIQNMTWNGVQGFESAPDATLSLNGVKAGTWHSERGLTFVAVDNAGHTLTKDQPALGLAVFSSFISTGNVGKGILTSSTGDFLCPSPPPVPRSTRSQSSAARPPRKARKAKARLSSCKTLPAN